MVVETRIYKQFDTDLLALCAAGYPVRNMMRDAIIAYASGTPLNYYLDEAIPFKFDDKKTAHIRFSIPDVNTNACNLLKSVQKGYRNSFCKAVLRNALIQINLPAFFSDIALSQLQNVNLYYKGANTFQNVIPLSTIRERKKQVTMDMSGNLTVEHDTGEASEKVLPTSSIPAPLGSAMSQPPSMPSPSSTPMEGQAVKRRGRPRKGSMADGAAFQGQAQTFSVMQPVQNGFLQGVAIQGAVPFAPFYQPVQVPQAQVPQAQAPQGQIPQTQAPVQVPVQGFPGQMYPIPLSPTATKQTASMQQEKITQQIPSPYQGVGLSQAPQYTGADPVQQNIPEAEELFQGAKPQNNTQSNDATAEVDPAEVMRAFDAL